MKHVSVRNTFCTAGMLLLHLMLLPISVSAQSDDAYLKALEAEAEAIASMPMTDSEAPEAATSAPAAVDTKAQERKEAFEKALQQTLPNTYTIYRKLPSEKKAIVVETYYFNEMKMPIASRQIFNFYFNDRKN